MAFYFTLTHFNYSMGLDGRECILRTLCETTQLFGAQGQTMIKEMLRSFFSFPSSKVLSFEHPDIKVYDKAYKSGKSRALCDQLYPKCSFSLHQLALGHYSVPNRYMMK